MAFFRGSFLHFRHEIAWSPRLFFPGGGGGGHTPPCFPVMLTSNSATDSTFEGYCSESVNSASSPLYIRQYKTNTVLQTRQMQSCGCFSLRSLKSNQPSISWVRTADWVDYKTPITLFPHPEILVSLPTLLSFSWPSVCAVCTVGSILTRPGNDHKM